MSSPEIRLDRDGQFFWKGVPCIRQEITSVFFDKLEADPAGGYRLRLGSELAPVAVEEAPFRVANLLEAEGGFVLCLDAGIREPFDPRTLRFEGDVPWCRARGLPARFTPTGALALGEAIADGRVIVPGTASG